MEKHLEAVMGKRWTPEEEKVMTDHYGTASSVKEVAKMLNRPHLAVIKKARTMGLKRPDQHEESVNRLKRLLDDSPRSSEEVAGALNITRNTADRLLQEGHKEGVCRISEFRANGGRGKDTPLWVAGAGENAKSRYAIAQAEREARKPTRKVRALTEEEQKSAMYFQALSMAFYGVPAVFQESNQVKGKVYLHLMDAEEELEAA
jgi:hypothetical protein